MIIESGERNEYRVVNKDYFIREFERYNGNQEFTQPALSLLFDHIKGLSDQMDKPMELEMLIKGIYLQFIEYTKAELLEEYSHLSNGSASNNLSRFLKKVRKEARLLAVKHPGKEDTYVIGDT